MADVFPFDIQAGAQGKVKHRVRKAAFGDGYVQRVGDGLNPKTQRWPVSFTGTEEEAQAIADWLDAHPGHISFLWTPPLGVQTYWVCEEYDIAATEIDTYTISATFEQSFVP